MGDGLLLYQHYFSGQKISQQPGAPCFVEKATCPGFPVPLAQRPGDLRIRLSPVMVLTALVAAGAGVTGLGAGTYLTWER